MNAADFERLFEYDAWANLRLLDAAEALGSEAWTREVASSFSSLRATLAHIAGAEEVWLQRWMGARRTAAPEWYKAPSAAKLREVFAGIHARRRTFLGSLSDAELERMLDYVNFAGADCRHTLADALMQVVNHSTYHRGQVVTLLRQTGATPPSTDFLLFAAGGE